MSLLSFVSDLCNSLTVSVVQAEAAPAEQRVESQPREIAKEEEPEAEQEPEKKEEGEEEEEEEEADEPQDPAPAIIEECTNRKECKPYKHHFDECVERVNAAVDGGPKEDCVEEFFHVLHCANECAAPKLWSKLK